jgi:hypothetical protein
MISTSSSLSSSAHFIGPKVINISGHRSSPNSVKFRAPPISAACTSTAERTVSRSPSTASSLYEVLGIQMGATSHEIKTAYRRLARVVHPDVAAKGQRSQTSGCEFMKVHEAYATLSDPERRADYDRVLYSSRRKVNYPMAMSMSTATTMGSGFAGHTRRKWETDQCW